MKTHLRKTCPVLGMLVLASACTDSPVSPKAVPEQGFISAEYACTADFRAGTLECGPVSPIGNDGPRLNLMLYSTAAKLVNTGGGSYSGSDKSNPDTMTYNVAIMNLIPQPIGTTDGITSDTSRLVITGFRLTSPTPATAQLDNADGIATFVDSLNGGPTVTYSNVSYVNYPGLLTQNSMSSPKPLRFVFSPNVTGMTFWYRIWTRVQYPQGYITIAPANAPVVAQGATTALTGTVYNQFGMVQPDAITWSSSDVSVATVNASTGQVTAVGEGTATITATSSVNGQRTGTRAVVVVDAAPAVDSTSPADGTFNAAPGTAIVVHFSEPVTVSAGSFTLGCTSGSQPFTIGGSGTRTVTLYPVSSLPTGDTCTATVLATGVSDVDTSDGPDQLAENHTFWFVVEGFGG